MPPSEHWELSYLLRPALLSAVSSTPTTATVTAASTPPVVWPRAVAGSGSLDFDRLAFDNVCATVHNLLRGLSVGRWTFVEPIMMRHRMIELGCVSVNDVTIFSTGEDEKGLTGEDL